MLSTIPELDLVFDAANGQEFLDQIKDLGYSFAFKGGLSFSLGDIIIPEQTLHYMIENHCNKEDGVRNLKRCLEIVYTKLNLYRLMRPDSNLFEEDMSLKVEFPFTVTKDIVDKLVKKSDNGLSPSLYMLYT